MSRFEFRETLLEQPAVREVQAFSWAAVHGTMDSIAKKYKEPKNIVSDIASTAALTAAAGLAAAEAPELAIGFAVGAGAERVWHMFNPFDAKNSARNATIGDCYKSVWSDRSPGNLRVCEKKLSDALGDDCLDVASSAAAFIFAGKAGVLPRAGVLTVPIKKSTLEQAVREVEHSPAKEHLTVKRRYSDEDFSAMMKPNDTQSVDLEKSFATFKEPDGTICVVSQNGMTRQFPDGARFTILKDGTLINERPNKPKLIRMPNGDSVHEYENGSRLIKHRDGSLEVILGTRN